MSLSNRDKELVQDLEHRIDTLQDHDESRFGSFTRVDHVILAIAAALIPIIAMIIAQ